MVWPRTPAKRKGKKPHPMLVQISKPKRKSRISRPLGFPATRTAKMRYVELLTMPSTTGSMAQYNFACNGIFDPNVTGIGHQPIGFDQWSPFYNNYIITGATMTVEAFNATPGVPLVMGVILSDDTTYPSAYATILENGLGVQKTLGGSDQGSAARTILKVRFNSKKFYNYKDTKDNFDRIGAAIGANPSINLAMFGVYAQSLDLTNSATALCKVRIDYDVTFSTPKTLAAS